MNILVVEDERNLADAIVRSVSDAGFNCEAVYDGSAGLTSAESGLYDAVIMDVMLPGMDGIQTLTRIRQHPEWKNIHVIFLTAAADKTTIVRAAQLKVKDYVKKPFTPDELISRVEKHIAPDIDDPEIQNIFKQLDSLGL